jgi:hypothetical protein
MKDFKKMPKMACGGGVKKYAEGESVEAAPRQNFATRKPTNIAEVQSEAATTARPFLRKPIKTAETPIQKPAAFKKGGSVRRYAEGASVTTAPAKNVLSEIQAESREMQAKGVPEKLTPEQMRAARMTRIAETFGAKPAPKRTGGSVKRKK